MYDVVVFEQYYRYIIINKLFLTQQIRFRICESILRKHTK